MKRNMINKSGWLVSATALAAVAFVAIGVSGCEDGMAPLDANDGDFAVSADGEQVAQAQDGDLSRRGWKKDGMSRKGCFDHKRQHRANKGGMVFKALEDLDLDDTQRTAIEALKADDGDGERLTARRDMRRGKGEFHEAFIAALETGNVDRSAFEPSEGSFDRARGFLAKRAERLDKLHDILTPEQRVALVGVVKDSFDREGGPGERSAKGGRDGDRWKRRGRGHDRLSWLEKFVDLDDAQLEQLEALRGELDSRRPARAKKGDRRAAMWEHRSAMLEAFSGDEFDAASFEPGDRPGFDKEAFVDNKVEMIEGLVDILTPEQRATLARHMKDRGSRFGSRR